MKRCMWEFASFPIQNFLTLERGYKKNCLYPRSKHGRLGWHLRETLTAGHWCPGNALCFISHLSCSRVWKKGTAGCDTLPALWFFWMPQKCHTKCKTKMRPCNVRMFRWFTGIVAGIFGTDRDKKQLNVLLNRRKKHCTPPPSRAPRRFARY